MIYDLEHWFATNHPDHFEVLRLEQEFGSHLNRSLSGIRSNHRFAVMPPLGNNVEEAGLGDLSIHDHCNPMNDFESLRLGNGSSGMNDIVANLHPVSDSLPRNTHQKSLRLR